MVQWGGDWIAKVIPNASRATIEPTIDKHFAKTATLSNDEWGAYDRLGTMDYQFGRVNHGSGEWVKG